MFVILHTTMGDIKISLDTEKAPKTAENFVNYVKTGHYNNTIFHRVIDGFMIQGGGMDVDMKERSTGAPIQNEANNGLKNDLGTIAMARTADPHSATAQFFINISDNDFLNFRAENAQGWGYAVFGKITKGMDTVEKIKSIRTGSHGFHQDVPTEEIIITAAEIVE